MVWLDNGILRLGFLPAAGGRLLSVVLRGQETLWRNSALLDAALHPVSGQRIEPHDGPMSAWSNYGGDKTWPAPQGWSGPGEWAGPPDPVLDSGPYRWETRRDPSGAAVITLTSADDPRSGLRIEREFTVSPGESAYRVRLVATNTGAEPVRWALWNVTQRAAGDPGGGGVWVGVDPADPRTVELAVGTGAPTYDLAGAGVIAVPHQDVVGKLGFPTASGWLAHAAGGSTTTQVVEVDPAGEYPDEGSRVEVWMEYPLDHPLPHLDDLQPSSRIVEVEVLGPLVDLAPGEATELTFRCATARGESPVRAVAEAGHWSAVTPHGTGGVTASFHAYVDGVLLLADDEQILGETRAGEPTELVVSRALLGRPVVVREHVTARNVPAGRLPQEEPA
ncbi:DUF4380 domain-containing protein [Aeromicrobium camelliae]|uniref:DUF4380 domain-containing protein n=1 Tax=Aeromicrobium camelliae TaxID=1538144 RepID=A0A3N6X707_9ACTN|nr:DUF4380 domain-containing protein [Aeromicrobium camelliae]